jgi:hypothetical protein
MNTTLAAAVALGAMLAAQPTAAASTAARQFQREHPCPSTGDGSRPCPGWIRDHIVAPGLRQRGFAGQYAMADDRRREVEGPVETAGLRRRGCS